MLRLTKLHQFDAKELWSNFYTLALTTVVHFWC